ncbi:MAG TPA: acyltransferase [Candidatus Faecimorpha stercoravium]|nr:acyltransferase [Candidatus Faecimorpha stercoravium]
MRKYMRIAFGVFRLLVEWILNFGKLKIHGIRYCISSGTGIWIHSGGRCDLGKKTWLSENCRIESHGGNIVFGYNNFFNTNCRIISMGSITIGDNNLFGPNVVVVDHNHIYSDSSELICKQGFSIAPVKIGSDIWVGSNVTICEGVEICDHVVIGANSVVAKSILKPGVYVGSPVRKIR